VRCDNARPICAACKRYAISKSENPDQAACTHSGKIPKSARGSVRGYSASSNFMLPAVEAATTSSNSTLRPRRYSLPLLDPTANVVSDQSRIARLEEQVATLSAYILNRAPLLDDLEILAGLLDTSSVSNSPGGSSSLEYPRSPANPNTSYRSSDLTRASSSSDQGAPYPQQLMANDYHSPPLSDQSNLRYPNHNDGSTSTYTRDHTFPASNPQASYVPDSEPSLAADLAEDLWAYMGFQSATQPGDDDQAT